MKYTALILAAIILFGFGCANNQPQTQDITDQNTQTDMQAAQDDTAISIQEDEFVENSEDINVVQEVSNNNTTDSEVTAETQVEPTEVEVVEPTNEQDNETQAPFECTDSEAMKIYMGEITSSNLENLYLHCGAYWSDSYKQEILGLINDLKDQESQTKQTRMERWEECNDELWSDYYKENYPNGLSPSALTPVWDSFMKSCTYGY